MFLVGVLPTDIFSVAPIIYIGYWESKTLSLMMNRNDLKKKKKRSFRSITVQAKKKVTDD